MNAAAAALAVKAARLGYKALLELPAPRKGEWRGAYTAREIDPGLWQVIQSRTDPLRLFVESLGLEFTWAGQQFSDGGSIPKWAQSIKRLRLKPNSFLKSYFHHDALYNAGKVLVREPGGKWHEVPVDREAADAQLYAGLTAEEATLAEAQVIYRAVRCGGRHAWEKCRRADGSETRHSSLVTLHSAAAEGGAP